MRLAPCGIIPALVTPLSHHDEVDDVALEAVLDYVLSNGVHGVFVLGGQGEFWAFDDGERARIIRLTVNRAGGKVPVYVGTAAATTREAVRLAQRAEALGADAVSVLTPFLIRPSQDELKAHFLAIAQSVRLPVLLYNHPVRAGAALHTDTVKELAAIDSIAGIKDSSGDMIQIMDYISECVPDFAVLCGHDGLIGPAITMGAAGAISSGANVAPRLMVELYNASRAGDIAQLRGLQSRLLPLRKAYGLGTFPQVVKEALSLLGLAGPMSRAPVSPLLPARREELRAILASLGLLPA